MVNGTTAGFLSLLFAVFSSLELFGAHLEYFCDQFICFFEAIYWRLDITFKLKEIPTQKFSQIAFFISILATC